MGLFSWFNNLGREKVRTADLINYAMKTSDRFMTLYDLWRKNPGFAKFCEGMNDTTRYNENTHPELFHWHKVALDCFSDTGRRHILDLEKRSMGFCGWIPYSANRMSKETDTIVREITALFPDQVTYVDSLTEAQSFAIHVIITLSDHCDDLICCANMLLCAATDDPNVRRFYDTWRNIRRYETFKLFYTWPLMSDKYRIIDYILDRGPFANNSKTGIPTNTKLADIESNIAILDRWKNTERGQMIINGFLPQMGVFIGDTLNLMAYKKNEYKKTEVEWIKCKLEQLTLKKQNSNDPDKMAHLQKLIDKYAAQMEQLRAEIDKYQTYKGE